MRRRGLASPDDGDALALTFAYPVAKRGCRTHNKAPATILPGGELISELPAQISVASRPQWGDHEVAWSLWSPFRSTAGLGIQHGGELPVARSMDGARPCV
jgi:hypothetical protein